MFFYFFILHVCIFFVLDWFRNIVLRSQECVVENISLMLKPFLMLVVFIGNHYLCYLSIMSFPF